MLVTILSGLVLVFFISLAGMAIIPVFFGAPWHPLSDKNIIRIIKFAGLKPGENFYDLGSGDGRVLIAAAKKKICSRCWCGDRSYKSLAFQIFCNHRKTV